MFMKFVKPILLFVVICLLFFYKTIIFGNIPFPGDLLLAGYAPWNHESYAGYVAGAIPTKNQYFDVIRELYPWKTVVINELKQGRFPLWNPHNFSGAPLLANYQSQVFYPFTFLYFLFPQVTAWTFMVIIQPILGAVFLYLFATEIGLSSAAAMLAAILFNFSSFANVWMEFTTVWHTILWLPLLLYLIERNVKQKKLFLWQQLVFIFALFSAITGGHPQDFLNSFLFLFIYIIARRSLSLFFLLVIPFFIAAPQIFPTFELFKNSARVAHDYQGIINHMLVQWWQMPLIAVSEFFGNPATGSSLTGDYVGKTLSVGVVGFFLTIVALWNKSSSWHKKFFIGTAIGILLLTVRTPISELLYRYPWPILSTGTPTRILFLLALALSVLAGFGYDAVRKSIKIPLILTWILILMLWTFADAPVTKRAMTLATAILAGATVITLFSKYKKIVLLAVIPLAVAELMYGFLKFNPFVPKLFVFPENKLITTLSGLSGINRFWGYGTAAVEANFATQVGLYSPDGTDPLNLHWYNRLLQASHDGNIAVVFNRTTRSDAQIAPGYGERDLPDNEFRLRVLDVLGVKYVLTRSENPQDQHTFPIDRFKLLRHVDEWTIYENLKAAPRFFITWDVRPYKDTADFEKQFFAPDFRPNTTVLVSTDDRYSLPQFTKSGNDIKLVSYNPNTAEFLVSSKAPAFLFFSDTYDTGWTARVNGKPARIVKTNYAFRGVAVPAGESSVEFSYKPKSFETGLAVSAIALFMTTLYAIYYYKRRSQ